MLILVVANVALCIATLLGMGVLAGREDLDRGTFVLATLQAVITGTSALYIAGVIR